MLRPSVLLQRQLEAPHVCDRFRPLVQGAHRQQCSTAASPFRASVQVQASKGHEGNTVPSPLGKALGRSKPRGKVGDSAGRGRGRGRTSGLPGSSPSDPYGLQGARDLPSLAALVERHVGTWAGDENAVVLRAAFNVLGKLASAPCKHPALALTVIRKLATAYQPLVPRLRDAYSCVTPLWACAKLGYWEGGLAEALLRRLEDGGLLQGATGQGHAKLWWSVSVAPQDAAVLANKALAASTDCLLQMTAEQLVPQDCSNVLLACARLQRHDSALVQHLTACLASKQDTKCQELANALYALADLGCTDYRGEVFGCAVQRLWEKVQQRLQHSPGGFVAQELSNMLWALEGLRPPGWEEYAGALADECRQRRFVSFSPQAVSNTVWSLAKMGWTKDQGWYEVAVAAAMQPGAMAGAKPQECSNLLYGLALVGHRPPEGLLQAVSAADTLETLRTSAGGQECTNLLWSLALLGLYEQRLVDVLVERLGELAQRNREQFISQSLANSLWALAVMGPDVLRRHSSPVEGLLREAVRRWRAAAAGDSQPNSTSLSLTEHLIQLWQVQQELLHAGVDCSRLVRILAAPGTGSRESLLSAARVAAETCQAESDPTVSLLQRQVVRSLEQLIGVPVKGIPAGNCSDLDGSGGAIASVHSECVVEGVCGRVDVVVEMADGRRVAVEVDGPVHFLANRPHTRTKNGPTKLRDRQLERVFGPDNVVSVPYWEWTRLRNATERGLYLCRRLGLE